MHLEVLTTGQKKLLNLLKNFSGDFGLVGGTATALQLGHRRSIDFDFLTCKKLQHDQIKQKIRQLTTIENMAAETPEELTLFVEQIKLTFLSYPFPITFAVNWEIKLADLLTIAAMKAYALGRRAKWKDYVDLFFILKKHSLKEIVEKAEKIFGHEFNERLFREQLAYHQDIDFSEKIIYLPGFETDENRIKTKLTSDAFL